MTFLENMIPVRKKYICLLSLPKRDLIYLVTSFYINIRELTVKNTIFVEYALLEICEWYFLFSDDQNINLVMVIPSFLQFSAHRKIIIFVTMCQQQRKRSI